MPAQACLTTDIQAMSKLFALAFSDSPMTAYLVRSPETTWPVSKIPLDILGPKMIGWTTYKQQKGAELVEAGNFAAAAIWFPPGVDLPSRPDDDPRVADYRELSNRIKKQFLKDRKHWYLNIIARHPERKEPGAVRALFDPYIARAREERVPLWLEAVSEHSRQVYEHIGFRTVATMRVGAGNATANGELKKGGEGILVYAMIME